MLRVPFRYPLLERDSYSMLNLVEIETDDGEHLKGKGREAAEACFATLEARSRLEA